MALSQEHLRQQKLAAEVAQLSLEIERLRSAVRQESNSRMLAEEALDETRDRLHLALEASGLAWWDWQWPTAQVFLTARWGEMLGEVAMDGFWDTAKLRERTHPEDRARVKQATLDLLAGNPAQTSVRFRMRVATGWRCIESHGMVAERDAKGQAVRLMGTLADITEQQATEQRQAEADQAKRDLLGNIGQEMHAPINALMDLTRRLIDSPLSPEQKGWTDLIDGAAHALRGQLSDALDVSRIDAGRLDIERVPFRLRETLEELSALYAGQGHGKSLEWSIQLARDLPETAEGDPGRVRQVVANLLSNALKFTPGGGRVRIAALVVGQSHSPRQWRLQVHNSGTAIPPELQASLLSHSALAVTPTTPHPDGHGQGLQVSARLLRLMGGDIEIQSEPGQGNRFTVTLPLIEPVAAVPFAALPATGDFDPLPPNAQFAGLTVLVAEDHPVNELLINQLLKRLGCQVRNARDGAQAVDLWRQGGVDLVLMDMQMPGTNGLQATRQIRKEESLLANARRTPIIAVTANALKGDREACLAAGVDRCTHKPVNPQALVRAMAEVLWGCALEPTENKLPVQTSPVKASPSADMPVAACAIDLGKLRRRLDGDETTLRQLAEVMRVDLGQRLLQLQSALQQKNADLAVAHAHGLKGSLGSMAAERGARLAKGLELAALAHDWSLFGRALPLMETEAAQIEAALVRLLSEPPQPAG